MLLPRTGAPTQAPSPAAWRYLKIPQKGFEVLQPRHLSDLPALRSPLRNPRQND